MAENTANNAANSSANATGNANAAGNAKSAGNAGGAGNAAKNAAANKSSLFREKNLERLESPEKLNDYLRVTSPGVWMVLGAVIVLLIGAVALPEFAAPGNPTDNEVVRRYVGSAEAETGAENAIAGMILNYRGFDTFGESCVLFLAVSCVMLLLWATNDRMRSKASLR